MLNSLKISEPRMVFTYWERVGISVACEPCRLFVSETSSLSDLSDRNRAYYRDMSFFLIL